MNIFMRKSATQPRRVKVFITPLGLVSACAIMLGAKYDVMRIAGRGDAIFGK